MTIARDVSPVGTDESQREALEQLENVLQHTPSGDVIRLVGPNGEGTVLPDAALQGLRQLVTYLAQEKAVKLVPLERDLTTQQAADLLNVSRPHLIKLLEQGGIPFTKAGTHRRIALGDIVAYKQRRDADRQKALTELTHMSEDLGLYGE